MSRRAAAGAGAALRRLAAERGVLLAYDDATGKRRTATTEALLAVVSALGSRVERPEDAPAALAALREERLARRAPPVAVAWDGEGAVELELPGGEAGRGRVDAELVFESGRARRWRRMLDRLPAAGATANGEPGAPVVDRLRLALPSELPAGYHRLRLEFDDGTVAETRVISAPRRAWWGDEESGGSGRLGRLRLPRRGRRSAARRALRDWGVFLPLYALRREAGDRGTGDLSDLEALGRWVGERGGGTVATLPLLAAFLGDGGGEPRGPFEPSPYAPASRLAWNELYVDPRRLPELEASPEARRLLGTSDFVAEAVRLAGGRHVDYRRAYAHRRRVLALLADAFFTAAPDERRAALDRLLARRPELADYAAFRAVGEARGESWHAWPEPLRSGDLSGAQVDEAASRFHLYAQLAADEQLAGLAAALRGEGGDAGRGGLYLDLPLGVHPDSFDVWRHRDLFATEVSAGAPPDDFFVRGQDWGFHPIHPERSREEGHAHWAAVVRHHLAHAGWLRIDHVMQLHRLWWVPRGAAATDGAYVRAPADELTAVLTLESHRARARLVGENLGTVPEYVDRALSRHRIARMFVLPFEVDRRPEAPALHAPPDPDVVASLNTHDMPTFHAFWSGAEIADRRDLGLLDDAEAAGLERDRAGEREAWRRGLVRSGHLAADEHDPHEVLSAALTSLGDSEAALVLVNLEDLWGEVEPQNTPGTSTERPNWRRRSRRTLEELARDPRVVGTLARLDAARRGEAGEVAEVALVDGEAVGAGTDLANVPAEGAAEGSADEPRTAHLEERSAMPDDRRPAASLLEPPAGESAAEADRPSGARREREMGSPATAASPTTLLVEGDASPGAAASPEAATAEPPPSAAVSPDAASARAAAIAERAEVAAAEEVAGGESLLSDDDLYLFNEGRHFRLYAKLGAHRRRLHGQEGYAFAVWAPNAEAVSVIGDFNGWDRDAHPLAARGASGIWEGFIPGAAPGMNYKLHVRSRWGGYRVDKADPFAVRSEVPPKTGSVLWHLDYQWGDGEWMADRRRRAALDAPVSIYEVHLGSWRRKPEEGNRPLGYREIAEPLAAHCRELGFTHVELLPVMEHPFYGSWGYQTTGYFAPTARFGTPQDLMFLIDRLHQEGIGVILDWVPSHFPTDEHGLAYFDGTHLFEHSDPREGFHPDWGSFIFNYGRHEVRSFLVSSALYWLDRFHADGLRVDAVASMLYRDYSRKAGEWVPNVHGGRENLEAIELLRQMNVAIYEHHPDVQTWAEESTAWPMVSRPTYVGGLGFGYKWDMGWMHDTLLYMQKDPVHRKFHQGQLTFRGVYAFSESFTLPLSHDEVVHGKGSLLAKMPGDDWQKLANLRLLYAYQWLTPAKKLLFMGGELAQWREWSHESSLDWHLLEYPAHRGISRLVSDLNRLYRAEPALHQLDCDPAGFEWIDASDAEHSVLAFLRRGRDDRHEVIVAAFNFTPMPRHSYRIGVPGGGRWAEVLNTDAPEYGGSGQGNLGGLEASPAPLHGRSHSLAITIPPLGAVVFKGRAR